MDATLNALAGILLKGLPTFILFLLLHLYLRRMFFAPIEKVLKQRHEATAGAKKAAQDSLAAAQAKARDFELKLDEVRARLSQEREATRKEWVVRQAARVSEARTKTEAAIATGKAQVVAEATAARTALSAETERLADEITNSVLRRTA